MPGKGAGAMDELLEEIDGLPNICGSEQRIEEAIRAGGTDPVFLPPGATGFGDVNSAFAVGLHMHQPLIPAGGPDLRTAPIISNLQWMMDNASIGDNHNAPVFLYCYKRMGEFVPGCSTRGSRRGSCSSTRERCCTACARWAPATWWMP